jgi:hypothetical protein
LPQLCVPLFFFCLFASLTHHQMLWFPMCGGKLWFLICTTTTRENPYWLENERKSSPVSLIIFTL